MAFLLVLVRDKKLLSMYEPSGDSLVHYLLRHFGMGMSKVTIRRCSGFVGRCPEPAIAFGFCTSSGLSIPSVFPLLEFGRCTNILVHYHVCVLGVERVVMIIRFSF